MTITSFPSHMQMWVRPGISCLFSDAILFQTADHISDQIRNLDLEDDYHNQFKRRFREKKFILFSPGDEHLPLPYPIEISSYRKALRYVETIISFKPVSKKTVKEVEILIKEIHKKTFQDYGNDRNRKGLYRDNLILVFRDPEVQEPSHLQAVILKKEPQSARYFNELIGKDFFKVSSDPHISKEAKALFNRHVHIGCSHEKVPALMQEMIAEVQEKLKKEEAVQVAAFAFMKFVTIHPFGDGNGRVARIFMNMILMENGHQPVSFVSDLDYSKAVSEDQQHNNGAFAKFLTPIVAQFDYEALPPSTLSLIANQQKYKFTNYKDNSLDSID